MVDDQPVTFEESERPAEGLPVLQPDNVYFVSSTGPRAHVLDVVKDRRIRSAYRVCGRNSWLLVAEPVQAGDASQGWLDLRDLRTGHVSHSRYRFDLSAEQPGPEETASWLLCFVFIKPLLSAVPRKRAGAHQALLVRLAEIARTEDPQSILVRNIRILDASEWWYVAHIRARAIGALSRLVRACREADFETSTKLVVTIFKRHGDRDSWHARNIRHVEGFRSNEELPVHFKLATIIRNARRYPVSDVDVHNVVNEMAAGMRSDRQLSYDEVASHVHPSPAGNYVWLGQLRHPNEYVDRISLRPVSPSWTFNFIFVRSSGDRSGRDRLDAKLQELIGVWADRIIPRVYKITGEFDYLIPAYTTSERARRDIESQLTSEPVGASTNTLDCRLPGPASSARQPLDQLKQAVTRALFRNAGKGSRPFWEELGDVVSEMRSQLRTGDATPDHLMQTVSPRALTTLEARPVTFSSLQGAPRNQQELGVDATWELVMDAGKAAFVRLYARSMDTLRALRSVVERCRRDHEIIFDEFVSPRPEVIGIARFALAEQLAFFLSNVERYCDRTEFHIFLERVAVTQPLDDGRRCTPCVAPVERWGASGPLPECSKCGRYLVARGNERALKLRVVSAEPGVRERPLKPAVVAVVDAEVDPNGLFRLGVFRDVPAVAASGDPRATTRVQDDHAFADALHQALTAGALGDCDIVVFPEYLIPGAVADGVVRKFRDVRSVRERLIVLGSHVQRQGPQTTFNVAPIMHLQYDGVRVYWQQKQELAQTLGEHQWITRCGTGTLLFSTGYGNVMVRVCSDMHLQDQQITEDVDLLLVPSYHPGAPTFGAHLRSHAERGWYYVGFSNGAASADPTTDRAESFVAGPARRRGHVAGHAGETVALGPITAKVFKLNIDVGDLDRRRAVELTESPQPPRDVFPLHVDRWQVQIKPAERSATEAGIAQRLAQIRTLAERSGGKLEERLTVEWREAVMAWDETVAQRRGQ